MPDLSSPAAPIIVTILAIIVLGEEVALAGWIEKRAPNATVQIIPGRGHNLLLEAPAAVAAALAASLSSRGEAR